MRSTKATISLDEVIRDPKKHLVRASQSGQTFAIADAGQTIAYIVGARDFEQLEARALRRFLKSRMKGPTVSHQEAFRRLDARLRRREKAS